MPDMICPLLELPDYRPLIERLTGEGIVIRRPKPWEREMVSQFIKQHFGQGWVDETLVSFSHVPLSAFIALDGKKVIGFAAYEATSRGYFGPTGVDPEYRGRGIGGALLYEALAGLKDLGYVYGFIGSPGPVEFYKKAVKALVLPEEWKNFHTR